TYTEFLVQVKNGDVKQVVINNSSNIISGTLQSGTKFTTTGSVNLSDADEQLLKQMGVDYSFKTPQANFITSLLPIILPFAFVIAFFMWMQRRAMGQAGSIMSVGKSKAKAYQADKPSTTFSDIAGYDGVKLEIKEVVDFLRKPERFKEIGARVPKGILLVGPPGTGKTLFARAVAGEAGVGFLSVTGSDFMEMFVGVGASRVRDLFAQAKKLGKAIIFIDEIDSIGRKRGAGLGGGHDEREQTLNQLLSEMDGFEATEGIVILAATNRPDVLDTALLRPGRFDRQIIVPLPEYEERLAILKVHSRDKRMGTDVDLETMARATPGMSGADLANLVNEAALFAVRRESLAIERLDFENARDRVVMGARRESLVLNPEEKRATAYHEGGHAVLAVVLPHSDPLHKVTILPRGMALGVTWTLPEERHTYSREFFEDLICKAMGGRVAEKIIFGHLNSGAANDLEQATGIARRMVREWGMSDKIGPMAWTGNQQVFLGEDLMTSGREYSDSTAQLVDDEISRILLEQETRAHEVLMRHRRGLELVAEALLVEETIDGPTVGRLVQQGLDAPSTSDVQA
ncbi:MAG: ATP-dependent zinc metalloprotease FtsH, partial [Ilumatobacteraceae bacterium]|nr:ATP-dependent zinc metalloprotease FtsH [Ilumatobacteraceae bacterium]